MPQPVHPWELLVCPWELSGAAVGSGVVMRSSVGAGVAAESADCVDRDRHCDDIDNIVVIKGYSSYYELVQ